MFQETIIYSNVAFVMESVPTKVAQQQTVLTLTQKKIISGTIMIIFEILYFSYPDIPKKEFVV